MHKINLKATLSAFHLKLNMVYDNSAESGVKNLGWERELYIPSYSDSRLYGVRHYFT